MLAMIIFMLDLFRFPVTVNSFTRFPSYTNFIFATESYCSSSFYFCSMAAAVAGGTFSSGCCSLASSSTSFSTMYFSLCHQYFIFSIILLYSKETVSCMLSSLSASASRVAVMDADTALYNFEIVFLKNAFIFYCIP